MYLQPYSIKETEKLGDIIERDYRTAEILNSFAIDFVVNSEGTLQQACVDKGLDVSIVKSALSSATRNIQLSNSLPFDEWKVDFLIDYIINVHHEYIKRKLPKLLESVRHLGKTDVPKDVEVEKLKQTIADINNYLLPHMQNEETSVFPYLKQVTSAWYKRETYGSLLVRTLRKPVEKTLLKDHDSLKELMQKIRKITNNYKVADRVWMICNVLWNQLQEFDNDLVQHIYLENKVLFPKIILIEKELLSLNISA
jgi:regulator of cell morphogenesis and NO signaling